MQELSVIFGIAILILSVVVHEVSHGYAAYLLGDGTAKRAGRLTMNPLAHLDLTGSVIVPLLLVILPGNFIFGWAKPVPYNPYNLKNQKWGPAIVAAAGPLANFLLAAVFGIVSMLMPLMAPVKAGIAFGTITSFGLMGGDFYISLYSFFSMIVWINIFLGIFNLVPIPPLDGSKVLFSALPYKWRNIQLFLEKYGLFVLIFFIFSFAAYLAPLALIIFRVFMGLF